LKIQHNSCINYHWIWLKRYRLGFLNNLFRFRSSLNADSFIIVIEFTIVLTVFHWNANLII